MNRRTFVQILPAVTINAGEAPSFAQETAAAPKPLQPNPLPKPETDGGKSVLADLQLRKTVRNIREDKLSPQTLANLLWAAWGVNREKGNFGKAGRTAASASNSQEIDLYVALAEGVYLYEALPHQLTPVVAGDFRTLAGRRGAATAPVNIFFVADLSRNEQGPSQPDRSIGNPEVQKGYYYVATGLIASNIYLFAASQGLAAWFHNCDREAAAKEFKLRPEQRSFSAASSQWRQKAGVMPGSGLVCAKQAWRDWWGGDGGKAEGAIVGGVSGSAGSIRAATLFCIWGGAGRGCGAQPCARVALDSGTGPTG